MSLSPSSSNPLTLLTANNSGLSSGAKRRPSANSPLSPQGQPQPQPLQPQQLQPQAQGPPPSKKQRLHPLRQTSFPADDDEDAATAYSADGTGSVLGSVTGSAVGGGGGGFGGGEGSSRGRKKRGRREREGTGSVRGAGGTGTGSVGGERAGASVVDGEGGEEGEDEEDDDADLVGGDQGGPTDAEAERKNLAILIDAFTPEQSSRYDMFKRAKLAKSSVRKIVNQTLSQSVPPNVVTTISGYTKVFIGELIERARTVQEEWAEIHDRAVREAMAADANAKAAAKTTTANGNLNPNTQTTTSLPANGPTIKQEDQGLSPSPSTVQPPHASALPSPVPAPTPAASPAAAPAPTPPSSTFSPNPHRGQLLPQHLREALRRYKRAGDGGSVGFSGLSDGGLGARGSAVWGVRGVGGRGLFR